jgi:hypothetical protein
VFSPGDTDGLFPFIALSATHSDALAFDRLSPVSPSLNDVEVKARFFALQCVLELGECWIVRSMP